MTTLITGVAGFIGSHLAEDLVKKGERVVGIDNLSTGREENLSQIKDDPLLTFVKGTVSNPVLLEKLIGSCDVIYHLAASVGVMLLTEKPVLSLKNNMEGLLSMLDLSNKYKRKLFFASSSEVYGKANSGRLNEGDDLTLGPTSVSRWGYGCSKAMAEYLALSYRKQYGLPVIVARFFNVCGPRQVGGYGMVIPRFVVSALKGEPIAVYGDGDQVRSFTYITDAVRAITDLMDRPEAEGEVFNVGNPRQLSISELARMVKRITKSESPIVNVSYEEAYGPGFEDIRYRAPDISKIEKATGLSPEVDMEEMIGRIADYWRNELRLA